MTQAAATPMMQQYFREKEKYQDTLLFFRMGDFFELFYDDAIKASKALDIALTKRGKAEGQDVPMCGVPAHSYEPYLQKLIRLGYKVAICDQLESPEEAKKRGGYKEIVRREVVRVVTAGTITEETLLDSTKANYLLGISKVGAEFGLAWVDISTGEFFTSKLAAAQIQAELARIKPSEILLPDTLLYEENLFEAYSDWKNKLTPQPNNIFSQKRAEQKLKDFYKVISLSGFGKLSEAEIGACGALLEYLELTQKMSLPALQFPRQVAAENFMQIDSSTRRNLEITESATGEGSYLLKVIDRTQTASGARLLRSLLSSPLVYAAGINARGDAVEFFFNNAEILQTTRNILGNLPDLERAVARVCIGRGSPRDMVVIRYCLAKSHELKNLLAAQKLPVAMKEAEQDIKQFNQLLGSLIEAFKDEVSAQLKDGNFIREGYSSELDTLVNIRDHSKQLIANLRDKYAEQTGITNLKITYNNILGYYIEITALNAKKMDESFIHRQTMANAMRFTTPELNEIQSKILNAQSESLQLEFRIFEEISNQIRAENLALSATAKAIAFIDFASSLATLAKEKNYTRPVVDDSDAFIIRKGRHPVVEENIEFTANNCDLSQKQNTWLLTGPNMAGKSTFLRQNALIAILAQIGAFVPAEAAHIGCVDRVFSRVGASDNLSKGQSTFMVEMVETAAIVNQATAKSLVILDEIGRGTATYDGLSIAWAVLEFIHNKIKCRTIFATHYHELTKIGLPRLALHSMKVKEWKDNIIFLHEVGSGAADKSYGIHVAKLAGLPKEITNRSEQILKDLESGGSHLHLAEEMPLFAHKQELRNDDKSSSIIAKIQSLDTDNLTPKECMDILFELKKTT